MAAEPAGEVSMSVRKLDALVEPRLGQVIELERESFPPCEQLGPHLMQQQAALRTCGLLVAELGAALAGYLLFSRTASSGLITKLAVAAPFRRQGVASSLLTHGINELERPGRRGGAVSEILLHVDPSRLGAQRLYEGFGFVRAELLPNYYSDQRDALLMRREHPAAAASRAAPAAAPRRDGVVGACLSV
jgi:ribosomal-protein-alanine N-acetyltransferase